MSKITTARPWNAIKHFKVNEYTKHQKGIWQNISGFNTEPGMAADWVFISPSVSRNSIEINGNQFEFRKHPENIVNLDILEANDAAKDGYWDNATFIGFMVYLGGDITLKASWNIITEHEQIPIA